MSPSKRGHLAAAYRIAKTINHAGSRRQQAEKVRAWAVQLRRVLGLNA